MAVSLRIIFVLCLPTLSMLHFCATWNACRCCSGPATLARSLPAQSFSPAYSSASWQASSGNFPASCSSVCLHRHHHQLYRLRSLRLDNNCISQLTFGGVDVVQSSVVSAATSTPKSNTSSTTPKLLAKRFSLQSDTNISGEDRSLMEQLYFPNITLLDLSNNSIESIPLSISQLTQLAELKISNNGVRELPPEIGLMKKLWFLDYSGCPVETTLHSLLGDKSKKTASVLGYLKSVHEEATTFNRMKLMFVGVQGIGKTTLLTQLRREEGCRTPTTGCHWTQRMHSSSEVKNKDHKGQNISTVGVDIGDLVIRRRDGEVVFRTWDFGGQREYYATHQYFLTKRSLYLVVWRLTDGEKGVAEILQWLINIQVICILILWLSLCICSCFILCFYAVS